MKTTKPTISKAELRDEYFDTLVRVAMKDMTIPQAKVFAITVLLHTDLYVEALIADQQRQLLDRLLDHTVKYRLADGSPELAVPVNLIKDIREGLS